MIASVGCFPMAVSSASIKASEPSRIAFAMSDVSALEGRMWVIIEGIISVAVIDNFFARLHFFVMDF